DGGPMEILQLWVNLPSRLKMTRPAYVGLQAADIPTFTTEGGVVVEPVSGEWLGVKAPIQSLIDIHLAIVRLPAGARFEVPVAPGRTVFFYAINGQVSVAGTPVPEWNLAALGDGDAVEITAQSTDKTGAVVLLGHAEPIKEPVFSHGPFVMTTREEIIQAIQDYQSGKFGPPPRV
ncbi:MAG: nuclease PIN, partial [Brevundimonas sp.]|nr:nuclease PIN [Brevundimonas sp.]